MRETIKRRLGMQCREVHVWRLLGKLRFSSRKHGKRALERDEAGIERRKKRTWAPIGQTTVIPFHFNRKRRSMIAGLTFTDCVFRLHEGAIRAPQFVPFLQALRRNCIRWSTCGRS